MYNFFNTAVGDVIRAIDGKSLTGSFILLFCLIDYIGWLKYGEIGGRNSRDTFLNWIKKDYQKLSKEISQRETLPLELYEVRNGLIHSYSGSAKTMKENIGGFLLIDEGLHLERINSEALHINICYFLPEVIYGLWLNFQNELISNNNGFWQRTEKQLKIFGAHPVETFYQIHSVLRLLDHKEASLDNFKGLFFDYYVQLIKRPL